MVTTNSGRNKTKHDERAKIRRKQCDSCQSKAQAWNGKEEARLKGGEESQGYGKRGVVEISKMVYGNARNRPQKCERERMNNRATERAIKSEREGNRE